MPWARELSTIHRRPTATVSLPPAWGRRPGPTGEAAARAAGHRTVELGATLSGEPLHRARGYVEVDRETLTGASGSVTRMAPRLAP